jgi:hypothetical protein
VLEQPIQTLLLRPLDPAERRDQPDRQDDHQAKRPDAQKKDKQSLGHDRSRERKA